MISPAPSSKKRIHAPRRIPRGSLNTNPRTLCGRPCGRVYGIPVGVQVDGPVTCLSCLRAMKGGA